MRTNLPVTTHEVELSAEKSIVSKTDLKGRITYINPYFIEVSGFTEEELMGSPHNLVRHPDMPPEAFDDLWRVLKSGLPWTGMVKNRCKNGDYYWVVANVTPIIERGQAVGYMSVRSKPTREQVAATDAIYRKFREGHARGLAIRNGAVVRTGLAARLAAIRDMRLSLRIGLGFGLPALLVGVMIAMTLATGVAGTMLGMELASLTLLLAAWLALQKAVVSPLHTATQVARAIAGGDLTQQVKVDRGDDTGQLLQALQQMSANLVAVVGDGSFYFGSPCSVFAVARQYQLPILSIVLDNSGWSAVKESTLRVFPSGEAKAQNEFEAELAPDVEFAKALCGTCPARVECLSGALHRREPWGVWGGEQLEMGRVVAVRRPRGRPAVKRTTVTPIEEVPIPRHLVA